MKKIKTIRGWAVIPSCEDSDIFRNSDNQFLIYGSKAEAVKENDNMDEVVALVQIEIIKTL